MKKIYQVSLFYVALAQTEEQKAQNKCGYSLKDREPFYVDGSVSIEAFMRTVGPQEAERMVSEYARRAEIEKPEIEEWGFLGFELTKLQEVPAERKTGVYIEQ